MFLISKILKDRKNKKLREEQYKNIIARREESITKAFIEYDGFKWLLDHQIDLDLENCIYHAYSNYFAFGWRTGIPHDKRDKLHEQLKDFPFRYEWSQYR